MIRLEGIPVIDTPRLRLRGPRVEDYAVMAAFMATDRSRFVGGPLTPTLSWRGFCHVTGHWVHRGYSMFIFADRQTGQPLGMAGPWFPEGWPEGEIGWSVWSAAAEGRGIAYEAATAGRRWAYEVLGWKTAISLIAEENTRSQALARRMGCQPEGTFTFDTGSVARIWRHPGPAEVAA